MYQFGFSVVKKTNFRANFFSKNSPKKGIFQTFYGFLSVIAKTFRQQWIPLIGRHIYRDWMKRNEYFFDTFCGKLIIRTVLKLTRFDV